MDGQPPDPSPRHDHNMAGERESGATENGRGGVTAFVVSVIRGLGGARPLTGCICQVDARVRGFPGGLRCVEESGSPAAVK